VNSARVNENLRGNISLVCLQRERTTSY